MAAIEKPQMPLLRETPDQIYQRMVNRMNDAALARGDLPPATEEGEIYYDFDYPIAEEISEQQQIDEYKFMQWFLPWADGEYLDAWGVPLGVKRLDGESDDSYRDRLEAKAAEEEGNGAESDYNRWVREVPGVGQIFIWGEAPNTVHIALTDINGLPATESLVAAVQTHLAQSDKHHMNDNLIVEAAKTVNLVIAGELLELDATATLQQVTPIIEAGIRSYAKAQQTKILYSEIYRLFKVAGVIDYHNVTVNGGTTNVDIPFAYIPVVQTVTVMKI